MKETLPYFMFKNRRSIDYGLIVKNKSTYNGAQRDVTFASIPGRDGDLLIDNGRYKNTLVTYELSVINKLTPWDFDELAQILRNWLLPDTGYYQLWDTYDKRHFRYAAYNGSADIEQELNDLGSVVLEFNCKPYRYSVDGQNTVIMGSAGTLYNGESSPSKPYIKVVGSGDITLTINGDSYILSDVSSYIELDSEMMNAYKGTTLLNDNMSSASFPVLKPGMNTIAWTGTVTQLEIVPRWRCL